MINYRLLAIGIVLLALSLLLFLLPWQAVVTLVVLLTIIGGSALSLLWQRVATVTRQEEIPMYPRL